MEPTKLSRRGLLQGLGGLGAVAGVGMPPSVLAASSEQAAPRTSKPLPQKNTPFPFPRRRFPFDKRTAARDKIWPNGARMAFITYSALEMWDWNSPRLVARPRQEARTSTATGRTNLDVRTSIKFGAEIGLRRLRDIWKDLGVKITLLTCGSYAEDFPDIVKELADLGHEINNHTYSYSIGTVELTREEQLEDIRKSTRILEQVTGKKPVGQLSTGASCDANTIELLAQEGYLYHCDLQDDELPYFIDVNGKTLVEIPYRMMGNINDHRYFTPTSMKPSYSLDYLREIFDDLYADSAEYPKFMIYGTHPNVTGRGDVAWVYQQYLRYAQSHHDVWFATYREVAEWWMKQFNGGYPV